MPKFEVDLRYTGVLRFFFEIDAETKEAALAQARKKIQIPDNFDTEDWDEMTREIVDKGKPA